MKKRFLAMVLSIACAFSLVMAFKFGMPKTSFASELKDIDMYLIAGQSNAAGYSYHNGTLTETFSNVGYAGETDLSRHTNVASSSNVDSFADYYWEVKAGYGRSSDRIGPEYGIAKELNSSYTKDNPAFIFKSAAGGTSLRDLATSGSDSYGNWQPRSLWGEGYTPNNGDPTGLQYYNFVENFKTVYNQLKANGYNPIVKGMAWMQGCDDIAYPNEYQELLETFINDIRVDLAGITGDQGLFVMPFVIGKIPTSFSQYNNPLVPAFNEAQQAVANKLPGVETVETSDLIIVNPDGSVNGADQYHFSCEDAVTLGQRFGKVLKEMTDTDGVLTSVVGKGKLDYTLNGETVTVTATPNDGYTLAKLTVNGVEVSFTSNVYTFTKTTEYVNIQATFKPNGTVELEYYDESVMDIAEYFSTTEFFNEEGISFESGKNIFKRSWLEKLLKEPSGISFKMKYAEEWEQNGNFNVEFGANIINFALNSNVLTISVFNALSSTEAIAVSSVENFNANNFHEIKIARTFTVEQDDDIYSLRVYIDDKQVIKVVDSQVLSADYHEINIINETGVNVNLASCKNKPVFEEETNVYDIVHFNGLEDLFSGEGLEVRSSTYGTNYPIESMPIKLTASNYVKVSNGIQWKMRASNEWASNANVMRIDIGATDIRLGYDKETNELYTYSHTAWSHGVKHLSHVAGRHTIVSDYDPTEWHRWKITRVKAIDADGYALRFYVDDQLRLELYTTGELTDKHLESNGSYSYTWASLNLNSIKMVNTSGGYMHFKTAFYSRPIVEAEECRDIFTYGASTELLEANGMYLSHGMSAIDSYTSNSFTHHDNWFEKTDGISFDFKATKDWGTGYDKLKILYGATDIRFNSKGNNQISIHVYSHAHDHSVSWGQELPVSYTFDETQWHEIKVTKRKMLLTSGSYDEKGIQVAVYIDGVKIVEVIQPIGGMWSFAHRRICVTNLASVDAYVRSNLSMFDYEFEEESITDLYDLPQQNQNVYYEDAFQGLEVNPADRVVNSVWTEKFSSTTNGLRFTLTSEEEWKTSGVQKTLVPLTTAELATLTVVNGKEMFKLNGNGELTEVATTGVDSGDKYKFAYTDWTSDWSKRTSGNGYQLTGEIDSAAWSFPQLYKGNNNQLHYTKDTRGLIMTPDWMAFKYHIHVDFGTITIGMKLTPDNKLVIRTHSRYSWVLHAQDYVRDENGNPIEFLTGIYNGDSPIVYNGKTLNKGDYFENTFQITKIKEVNGKGFITRVYVNGYLGAEVYDPNPLGGENAFSHLLIDNLTGTVVTAYSVVDFDGFKNQMKNSFSVIDLAKYSNENASKIQGYIDDACTLIDRLQSIISIREIVEQTNKNISKVWTVELETEFNNAKLNAIASLNDVAQGNYESADQILIDKLIADATAKIQALTTEEGFGMLEMIIQDLNAEILAIPTAEERAELRLAITSAVEKVNAFANQFVSSNYSQENFALICSIKDNYIAKINVCNTLDEIETLTYLAYTDMCEVPSNEIIELNKYKATAIQNLNNYKVQENYLDLDWAVITNIIALSTEEINKAEAKVEIDKIVAETKAKIDGIPTIGDESMMANGSGADNNPTSDMAIDVEENAIETQSDLQQSASGCSSSAIAPAGFSLISLFVIALIAKKKRGI